MTDDAAIDAPPPCKGPYQPGVRLALLSSPSQDAGGMLSDDGLELYFGSGRPGGAGLADLYVSRRSSKQEAFGAPSRIVELSTALADDDPFIEPDGLTLWFNSGPEILRATRATRTSGWDPARVVTELDTTAADEAPGFTSDGLTVYFDSGRDPNLGVRDLWSARRATRTSPFSMLQHEMVASSNSFDCCPHVLPGDAQVAFTTQRSGDVKIYVADRLADGTLGAAVPFTLVNTTATEFDIFSTPDDTTIGVSSDRMTAGDVDLWLYERSCP